MPTEIAIPFSLASDGTIAVETDPDRQIDQHVKSLIGTQPGERVMLPDYGVAVADLLFEPGSAFTANQISTAITAAFQAYEPGVILQSATPIPDPSQTTLANIQVEYQRRESPNSPSSIANQTNTAVVAVGGTVSEVITG